MEDLKDEGEEKFAHHNISHSKENNQQISKNEMVQDEPQDLLFKSYNKKFKTQGVQYQAIGENNSASTSESDEGILNKVAAKNNPKGMQKFEQGLSPLKMIRPLK